AAPTPAGRSTRPGGRAQARGRAHERSVIAEEVANTRVERDGDLVQRAYRGARLGALDLRQERHGEPRAARHLLERQVAVLAQVADGLADDAVQVLFGRAEQPLLAHHAVDDHAELFRIERLLEVVDRVELHRLHGRL